MSANQHARVSIGDTLNRTDGPKKVTGQAHYAAERIGDKQPLIAWVVESPVAYGKVENVDISGALSTDGVHAVLNAENSLPQRPFGEPEDEGRFTQSRALLNSPEIRYHGFPVALVIADTIEIARYAASLVKISYNRGEPALLHEFDQAEETPDSLDGGFDPDVSVEDAQSVFNNAAHTIDAMYTTPSQISAAMEPHACIADYDGTTLTVKMSVQIVASAVEALANTLKLDKDNVHISSPFVGGGFGSKLGVHNDAVLASLGAMHVKRPVKLALSRRQVFRQTPHRGNSWQRIALGAQHEGRLAAVIHQSAMPMARGYEFAEAPGAGARVTYQFDALKSTHRVKTCDVATIDSTRAPGDAIGSLAFECAVDELADKIGMDPLQFRINNMPDKEPFSGKPFSSFHLKQCLEQGAEEFGWRNAKNKGHSHLRRGQGVASAIRLNMITPCEADVVLSRNGDVLVETDMTDIGTGTYTILAQIVCETLDVPLSRVTVNLGDSRSPASCGSGGSFGASSAGMAVLKACQALKKKAGSIDSPPAEAFDKNNEIRAHAAIEAPEGHDKYAQYSTGAHFAEVEVNTVTGEVRLIRQHGVFSAGRILNHKTAASQLQGGMIWGAGYALMEQLHQNHDDGSFANPDFADYHIPTHRDIAELSLSFIEEPDYEACELGSKGIGELGICGAGAAIANAVFDACGVRVRDFPLTPDKVLKGLLDNEANP